MPFKRDATGPDIIDIWTWDLDAPDADLAARKADLCPQELARAARFVHQRDRDRFIVGRSTLRRIAGFYLGLPARRVGLTENAFGKPVLAGACAPPLHFNLSHAGGHAAFAISDHYPVGIDIEEIKPLREDVAGHFFSVAECAALSAMPTETYLQAFYRVWTRKEAFVKAHGAGLSLPLDSFDVTVEAGLPPRLERLEGDPDASDNWQLLDLGVGAGMAGAVAALTVGNRVGLRHRCVDELAGDRLADITGVRPPRIYPDQTVSLASRM